MLSAKLFVCINNDEVTIRKVYTNKFTAVIEFLAWQTPTIADVDRFYS